MEVSVSFTDGSEIKDPEVFDEDRTEIGRAFIAKDRVLITGDLCVRYEKYPWIEKFEVDGAKAAPAKRTGIGTKDARGFVKSLSTIYSRAYDEYYEFGGKADSAADFDAEGYFIHAAEYFLGISRDAGAAKLYRRFCGFVENMWREGNEQIYHVTMDQVLPLIRNDAGAWQIFKDNITQEFSDYISGEIIKEKNNG